MIGGIKMQIYNIKIDENKKETTNHGVYEFPIQIYETFLEKNVLGFVNWHWHEEVQFCLVTNGRVDFYVSENKYTLDKGQGIFINSGYLHMAKPLEKESNSYICIDFNTKFISSFQGSIIKQKYVDPYIQSNQISSFVLKNDVNWQDSILDKIRKLNRLYYEKNDLYEFDIYILL